MPGTTWERLHGTALDQHGFVTTQNAREAGVDPNYLRLMVHRGTIESVAYGLYRFPQVPVDAQTPYMEAVLWVGEDAVLSHDAVLALHDLASANPSTIRVSTPRRVRKSNPPGDITIVQRQVPEEQRTRYFNIPSTTVHRAILDCRDLIMRSRLVEAAHEARTKGLVRRRELEDLLDQLGDDDG